jgi:sterol desaturase/sphingolipid hydroxylase (fatty acid hydroxylase superfamily)
MKREARTARRRFYPVTVLYSAYALVVLGAGFRARPGTTLGFFGSGVAVWTWLEYTVHRYVLHGRFPDGPGRLQHLRHRFFDTMHGDHHQRPWDGLYINGFLDSLPFAIVFVLLSLLAPLPTAPALVAGLLECYVIEEWVHYSVHFHRFRWRYFDYIRRHHLYHHSPRGAEVAFGLTNGLWDVVLGTRIPAPDRRLLYGRGPKRA